MASYGSKSATLVWREYRYRYIVKKLNSPNNHHKERAYRYLVDALLFTVHCLQTRTDHCLQTRTVHCLQTRTDHCLKTRTDHCLQTRTVHCLQTQTDHCLQTPTVHCLQARINHCLQTRTDCCLQTRINHCLQTRTVHCLQTRTVNYLQTRTFHYLQTRTELFTVYRHELFIIYRLKLFIDYRHELISVHRLKLINIYRHELFTVNWNWQELFIVYWHHFVGLDTTEVQDPKPEPIRFGIFFIINFDFNFRVSQKKQFQSDICPPLTFVVDCHIWLGSTVSIRDSGTDRKSPDRLLIRHALLKID